MYFPYLYGKKNELAALKELSDLNNLSKSIVPVIEPVPANFATKEMNGKKVNKSHVLNNLIRKFVEEKRKIAIVQNPRNLGGVSYVNQNDPEIFDLVSSPFYIPVYAYRYKNSRNAFNLSPDQNGIAIFDNQISSDDIDDFKELQNDSQVWKMLSIASEIAPSISSKFIVFEDKFLKRAKNAEYIKFPDEFFSSDYLRYTDPEYIGFGDYSMTGSELTKGFRARAVAIHIIYFDKNMKLRIKHFVSDSNEDYSDQAGKLQEATDKISLWLNSSEFSTLPVINNSPFLHQIISLDHYTGLGFIKKLSLEHHLDIISRYLDNNFDEVVAN